MSPEDWEEWEAKKRQAKGLPTRGKCCYVGPPIADIARGMVVANMAEQAKAVAITAALPAALEGGIRKAKVLAHELKPNCTRTKLHDDLLRGDGTFHDLNLGGGRYRKEDVINRLKELGQWRDEPARRRLSSVA